MNFKQCIVLIPLLMATVVVQSWSRTICRAAWPASGDSSCVGKLSLNLQMKTAKTRRISPANRYETTPQGAPSTTPKIHVMMKLQGDHPDVVVDSLRRSGITVYGRLGNIVTASLSESDMSRVASNHCIQGITSGGRVQLATDQSRMLCHVDEVLQATAGDQTGLPRAFTGKGVTIGMIDTGFDFQHPAFRDADGRLRIKAVYNPYGGTGNAAYDQNGHLLPGTVYDTPEMIEQLTADRQGEPIDDGDASHGSHTTGIAAGRHHHPWGGMAPDADIVLCMFLPAVGDTNAVDADMDSEAAIANALMYLVGYAHQSHQPMVVNMSLYSQDGPHNGRGYMPELLDAVCAEGLHVVLSSCNLAHVPVHIHQVFRGDGDVLKTFARTTTSRCNSYSFGYFRTLVPATVRGCIVDTLTMTKVFETDLLYSDDPQEERRTVYINTEDGSMLAHYFDGELEVAVNEDANLGQTAFAALIQGTMRQPHYLFSFEVTAPEGSELDVFNQTYEGLSSFGQEGYEDGLYDMSLSDWTSCPSVITVGAFVSSAVNRQWNRYVDESFAFTVGEIGYFSAYGTSLNGVSVPTVCGPGLHVTSCLNHYNLSDADLPLVLEEMQWNGYIYGANAGTSMSAPCVAGILALWLEADPTLTQEQLKDLIAHTSTTDHFVSQCPERWGNGKINALAGLRRVLGIDSGIDHPQAPEYTDNALYTLQGIRVGGRRLPKGVYIQGRKAVVCR